MTASSLWRNRDFTTVWLGQGVSALGDAVTVTALPLLVLALTGSGLQMGVVGTLQALPDLLFGLPAGALADRWDRRRLMLCSDFGRAVLTALIPLSVVLHVPTMPVVLAVTAPISLLRVLFLAGYTACLPNLVGREQIGRANSYLEAIFSVGYILGPGIAGLLAGWIGPGPTLAIDALSFLASVASLSLVRRPLRASTAPEEAHFARDIWTGITFVVHHTTLRTIILFWGLVSVVGSALVPVVTFFIEKDRGLPGSAVGLVISAYSVGYLAGSLLASQAVKGRVGLLMLAGTAGFGGAIVLLALARTVPLMMLISTVAGVGEAVVLISYVTLRATGTPDELMGRVGSTARTITLGVGPLGLLAGGVLLDRLGGALTLLLCGGWILLAGALFAFSPVFRNARAT